MSDSAADGVRRRSAAAGNGVTRLTSVLGTASSLTTARRQQAYRLNEDMESHMASGMTLRRLFRVLDADNDKSVTHRELHHALITMRLVKPSEDLIVARIMLTMDTDRTGKVTEDEFVQFFRSTSPEQLAQRIAEVRAEIAAEMASTAGGKAAGSSATAAAVAAMLEPPAPIVTITEFGAKFGHGQLTRVRQFQSVPETLDWLRARARLIQLEEAAAALAADTIMEEDTAATDEDASAAASASAADSSGSRVAEGVTPAATEPAEEDSGPVASERRTLPAPPALRPVPRAWIDVRGFSVPLMQGIADVFHLPLATVKDVAVFQQAKVEIISAEDGGGNEDEEEDDFDDDEEEDEDADDDEEDVRPVIEVEAPPVHSSSATTAAPGSTRGVIPPPPPPPPRSAVPGARGQSSALDEARGAGASSAVDARRASNLARRISTVAASVVGPASRHARRSTIGLKGGVMAGNMSRRRLSSSRMSAQGSVTGGGRPASVTGSSRRRLRARRMSSRGMSEGINPDGAGAADDRGDDAAGGMDRMQALLHHMWFRPGTSPIRTISSAPHGTAGTSAGSSKSCCAMPGAGSCCAGGIKRASVSRRGLSGGDATERPGGGGADIADAGSSEFELADRERIAAHPPDLIFSQVCVLVADARTVITVRQGDDAPGPHVDAVPRGESRHAAGRRPATCCDGECNLQGCCAWYESCCDTHGRPSRDRRRSTGAPCGCCPASASAPERDARRTGNMTHLRSFAMTHVAVDGAVGHGGPSHHDRDEDLFGTQSSAGLRSSPGSRGADDGWTYGVGGDVTPGLLPGGDDMEASWADAFSAGVWGAKAASRAAMSAPEEDVARATVADGSATDSAPLDALRAEFESARVLRTGTPHWARAVHELGVFRTVGLRLDRGSAGALLPGDTSVKTVAVTLMDAILEQNYVVRDLLKDWSETLERNLTRSGAIPLPLHTAHIYALGKTAELYQRSMAPLLSNLDDDGPATEFLAAVSVESGDTIDDLRTILADVEGILGVSTQLRELYTSLQEDFMNRSLFLLTITTAMFIPGQLITGLYGMNFDNMPELHWEGAYFVVLGVMVLLIVTICGCFRRMGFFHVFAPSTPVSISGRGGGEGPHPAAPSNETNPKAAKR